MGQEDPMEKKMTTHSSITAWEITWTGKPGELLGNWASLVAHLVKNLPAMPRTRFDPSFRTIVWRREWPPTPVFLPEEFHGQRSLAGYSPWGHI